MKFQFLFFFLFLIFSVSFVSATITPNQLQLNFDLIEGGEECQVITITSNEPASAVIQDVWAEEYNKEKSLGKFTYSAEDHGLKISYENSLEFVEAESKDIHVCITASQVGKYQGALIFAPQGESGNVIQYSTWLKVIVVEKSNVQNENSDGSGGSSGGGSSTSNSSNVTNIQTNNNEIYNNEIENVTYNNSGVDENEARKTAGITGSVIGGNLGKGNLIGLAVLIILICVIAVIVYNRKSKNEKI